jgi:hypothetical protein
MSPLAPSGPRSRYAVKSDNRGRVVTQPRSNARRQVSSILFPLPLSSTLVLQVEVCVAVWRIGQYEIMNRTSFIRKESGPEDMEKCTRYVASYVMAHRQLLNKETKTVGSSDIFLTFF